MSNKERTNQHKSQQQANQMAYDHHNQRWNLVRSCLVFGSVKVITVISAMPATLIPTKASPWSGIANNRPELINANPRSALYLLLCWLLPRPPYLNTTHAQSKTKDLDAWCNAKPETWLTKSFVFMVFFLLCGFIFFASSVCVKFRFQSYMIIILEFSGEFIAKLIRLRSGLWSDLYNSLGYIHWSNKS